MESAFKEKSIRRGGLKAQMGFAKNASFVPSAEADSARQPCPIPSTYSVP
jgi:hypothetical protein